MRCGCGSRDDSKYTRLNIPHALRARYYIDIDNERTVVSIWFHCRRVNALEECINFLLLHPEFFCVIRSVLE